VDFALYFSINDASSLIKTRAQFMDVELIKEQDARDFAKKFKTL
jgi:hypothetical protein